MPLGSGATIRSQSTECRQRTHLLGEGEDAPPRFPSGEECSPSSQPAGCKVAVHGDYTRLCRSRCTTVRPDLSLEDVVRAGLPGFFRDYGDQLVYLDGRILDATDGVVLYESVGEARDALRAVGLEYGWRHAADCRCAVCQRLTAPAATAEGLTFRSLSRLKAGRS